MASIRLKILVLEIKILLMGRQTVTAGKLCWRPASHLFHRAVFLHWHSSIGNVHVLRSGATAATTTFLLRLSPKQISRLGSADMVILEKWDMMVMIPGRERVDNLGRTESQ